MQKYSRGMLSSDKGGFASLESVELSQAPLIDISAERTDGDPEHSGNSILRGTLPAGG